MKLALINGIKVEAAKGLKGKCSNRGPELIAKCGEVKCHQWAHKGIRHCERWWENETEWHRLWKGKFPTDWQEISLPDHNKNEMHVADVRIEDGLVIEFQHSFINPDER